MEQIEDKQQNKSFNFNVDMNKQQATKKRAYVCPEIEVIKLEMESLLGQFSGQHEEATHETTGAPEEGSETPTW